MNIMITDSLKALSPEITTDVKDAVTCCASSRLHCALINESGLDGRIDGGVGFALAYPFWRVSVARAAEAEILGLESKELIDAVGDAVDALRFGNPLRITVDAYIEPHIGLGSKTSLLLAVGASVRKLQAFDSSVLEIAETVGRGGTSGVGVHLFSHGHFVWDSGRTFPEEKSQFGPSSRRLARPPTLYRRHDAEWLTVVHFRFTDLGVYGQLETNVFGKYCPVPHSDTRQIQQIMENLIWRGLSDRNNDALQMGIRSIQCLGFKRAEWGIQSDATKAFRRYWEQKVSSTALGLSSMGPTMYCITADASEAIAIIRDYSIPPHHLVVTKRATHGARFWGGSV